jgi:hypothetical protein
MSRRKKKLAARNTVTTKSITPATAKRVSETWTQDYAAEKHLRDLGLDFEMKIIRIDDIDRDLSLRNNARVGEALNVNLALDYAELRDKGDVFPASVVSSAPSASLFRYVTQSGNHRTEMERILDQEYIQAYVITTDNPSAIDTFARSINRKTGKRQDQKEAMVHALHELQKDDGSTVANVAEQFGLKYGTVSNAQRATETRKTLEDAGVEGAYTLAQDSVLRLYSLRHSIDVMAATATLVVKYAVSATVVRDVVVDIALGQNDVEKMERIAHWTKRFKASAAKATTTIPDGRKKPIRQRATQGELFRTYFGNIYNFLHRGTRTGKPIKKLSQISMSSEAEIARYQAEYKEMRQVLDVLFKIGE